MARFTNRDRLRRRLKAIPVEVRKAARAQLKANAEQLVETQKRLAPVDTGELKDSIRQQDTSTSTRISRRVSAGRGGVPYAAWAEFGTTKNSARPFFWPAYRMLRRRFRARMTRATKKAIQEGASKP